MGISAPVTHLRQETAPVRLIVQICTDSVYCMVGGVIEVSCLEDAESLLSSRTSRENFQPLNKEV